MDKKNKVTVEIFGESYALRGSMAPEEVIELAEMVDRRMQAIARSSAPLPPVKVAVMAALNIADEYKKLERDYNQLIAMLKEG